MSRALNIDASVAEVTAACTKHCAPITAIEALPAGGTRVVLANGDAAAVIRRAFTKSLFTAPQARTPLALASRGVPFAEAQPPERSSFAPRTAKR